MLMKMLKGENEIDRLSAAVSLPDKPPSLTLAENTLAKLESDKVDADNFAAFLQDNFNRIGLKKPDGTAIQPNDANAFAEACQAADALGVAIEAARRQLADERRNYERFAEEHTRAGCEAVASAMLDDLDRLEEKLAILSDLQTEAAANRVTVPIRTVSSPLSVVAHHIRALRITLRSRP